MDNTFNYSKLHFFDKNGNELILKKNSAIKVSVQNNDFPDKSSEFALVVGAPEAVSYAVRTQSTYNAFVDSFFPYMEKLKIGSRYPSKIKTDPILHLTTETKDKKYEDVTNRTYFDNYFYVNEYQSSFGKEYSIDSKFNELISDTDYSRLYFIVALHSLKPEDLVFPSYTFESKLEFDRVSTELVETQKIYVLIENPKVTDEFGNPKYTTIQEYIESGNEDSEIVRQYFDRFKLFFFIDCREQKDFRLFDVVGDEVIWSDRHTLESGVKYSKSSKILDKFISYSDGKERDNESMCYYIYDNIQNGNDYYAYNFGLPSSGYTNVSMIHYYRFDEYLGCDEQFDKSSGPYYQNTPIKLNVPFNCTRIIINNAKTYLNEVELFTKNVYSDTQNDFSVSIGFSGENEGVYEQSLHVCLIDSSTAIESENFPGDVYPIGEIKLIAETEGEDERYRTLFTNFGIPDPKEYDDVFRETEKLENLPDYKSINKHSKKMFLSYPEIFPYVGTYKALINAIKVLGYDDIFFKEWYKKIGEYKEDDKGYVAYDISYGNDNKLRTINNTPLEERIQLRKLNWLSMMYKINEVVDGTEDRFGFPTVKWTNNYYNTDNLVKLISLKKWLEKYVLGLNCHITDVGGEGVVFERYSLPTFGKYQKIFDYINERALYPCIDKETSIFTDGSANINVTVHASKSSRNFTESSYSDEFLTVEDCKSLKFEDFCFGYFDETKTFNKETTSLIDSSSYIYYGMTFDLNDNTSSYELRALGKSDTFRFGESYIDSSTPSLLIYDDKIIFDPSELLNKDKNTIFKSLPIIKVKTGIIKKYKYARENYDEIEYYSYVHTDSSNNIVIDVSTADSSSCIYLNDTLILYPPEYLYDSSNNKNIIKPLTSDIYNNEIINLDCSNPYNITTLVNSVPYNFGVFTNGLRFSIDNKKNIPSFKILGYESPYTIYEKGIHYPPLNNDTTSKELYEYYISIFDGSMMFYDKDNDREVSLNFKYNEYNKNIEIDVTTLTKSKLFKLYSYQTAVGNSYVDEFLNGLTYEYFYDRYLQSADYVVKYNGKGKINVKNTGEYKIGVTTYDEYNNIFSKTSNQIAHVVSPNIDVNVISNLEYTQNEEYKDGDSSIGKLIDQIEATYLELSQDASSCIYDLKEKYNIKNYDRDSLYIEYDGFNSDSLAYDTSLYTIETKKQYKYVTINNLSNRFIFTFYNNIIDNRKYFYFYKDSPHKSNIYCDSYEDIQNIVIKANTSLGNDIENTLCPNLNNIDSFFDSDDELFSIDESTGTSAYLLVYDDIYEYPVCCISVEAANSYMYRDNIFYQYTQDELISSTNQSNYESIFPYLTNKRYSFYIIPIWMFKTEISSFGNGEIIFNIKNKIDASNGLSGNYPFTKRFEPNELLRVTTCSSKDNLLRKEYSAASYVVSNKLLMDKNKICVYSNSTQDASTFYENIWISPQTLEFTEYITKLSNKTNCKENKLYLDISSKNREIIRYVDKTMSVSLRDFDITNGHNMWKIYEGAEIEGMYLFNVPTTSSNGKIIILPDLMNVYPSDSATAISTLYNKKFTSKWSVYKKSENNDEILLFECFNKALFLELTEKGDYGIKLSVFDEYGNMFEKSMSNTVTVI